MDKINLNNVNVKILRGTLNLPRVIGTWREASTLEDADVELELDVDQLETEYLQGILEERGLFVAEQEPTLEKYSDREIAREAEYRGYYVDEDEPQDTDISEFSTEDLRAELKFRSKAEFVMEDLGWYLRAGQYEEFLIHLERSDPVQFRGASKLKLSNE